MTLVITTMCTVVPRSVQAAEDKTKCSNMTEAFEQASEDTIVCYMDGVPITKAQVNDDGMVLMDESNMVANDLAFSTYAAKASPITYVTNIGIPYGTTKLCNLRLVYPQKSAIIKTAITAPRYS